MRVASFTLEDLGTLIRAHRADDSVSKAVIRILRAELVVIDDIGLLPVAADVLNIFLLLASLLEGSWLGDQSLGMSSGRASFPGTLRLRMKRQ